MPNALLYCPFFIFSSVMINKLLGKYFLKIPHHGEVVGMIFEEHS